MKRAVTIQDISRFGKCSVTVALPVISAMGVECAVIPTAVLSTHTGGFSGYTFRDLSEDIPKITEHWKREGLKFDGAYTGYLGSPEQAGLIADFVADFKPSLMFMDPVMADNGHLYSGFDMNMVSAMRSLSASADIIVPNLTEAAFLLDEEYRAAGEYDRKYVEGLLKRLAGLGAKKTAVTGIVYDEGMQGAVGYDSESGEYCEYFRENLPISCHGTGDVFASVMFASMLLGRSYYASIKLAVDNTVNCIKRTMGDKNHWYGVKFEECIPELISML